MVLKTIDFIVLFSLILLSSASYSQSTLELFNKERSQLIAEYKENPQKGIKKKIDKKEEEILLFIEQNGFEVTIKTFFEYSEIEIRDKLYLGTTIGVLKGSDKVIILERLESGHFKVKTKDNRVGYIYHTDFIPSLKEYPLNVLVKKTTTQETTKNTIYTPGTKSSTKGCSTVQCSGTTQKGSRCRNKTTNCSGRCHLH